ncbi:MAG: acetyl-CoA carboxylase carboxyltransferase subunit alpha [Nitrospiraceae bacterium]|jgi:acetyl-CoA carboxylase carboxyl transferase subunit alpha|nr:acetyl-CoA carboxylase carboxyltransferase subunit alpha [Nitrospirota bacterium]MDA8337729.1 acetyl-CoA carboxylase carboxyltransferase subunit alpha [Nitrospiraceae bacterium]
MGYYLDFEKPLEELETKIEELKKLSDGTEIDIASEIKRLEKKAKELRSEIFSNLTPWQKTMIARHPERPYTLDYISMIVEDFIELHGDRRFADDPAIVGGVGKINGIPVVIIGHQKGRGTKERIFRNFGQPNPEGYRKAIRLMRLSERFKMPIVTFIDTPGAYPGIGAEERGQAEAIATNLMEMSRIKTPIIAIVIGEGGSGGALALSVADRLYMLEHSVYSVISPEGCAAILWRKGGELTSDDFLRAADALKLTADDLKSFKIIDDIIPEPLGGAHREPETTAKRIAEYILKSLESLQSKSPAKLIEERYKKIRKIGSLTQTGQ